MSHATDNPRKCGHEDCTASFPSSRWHQIRAQQEGWFFPMEGEPLCPKHKPKWVDAWRAKKAAEGKS